jgi:hypothetical protein
MATWRRRPGPTELAQRASISTLSSVLNLRLRTGCALGACFLSWSQPQGRLAQLAIWSQFSLKAGLRHFWRFEHISRCGFPALLLQQPLMPDWAARHISQGTVLSKPQSITAVSGDAAHVSGVCKSEQIVQRASERP